MMTRKDFPKRAVITGIGPVTACGIGREAFWDGLKAETSPIDRVTRFDASPYHAKHSAEVRDFDPTKWFPPHRLKRLDRYSQFAVAAAQLAVRDAGLGSDPIALLDLAPERAGVSFGSALSGISGAEAEHANFLERGPKAISKALALQVFGGAAHSNIAIEYGLWGPATTNSNSCSSGNVAIGDALHWIRTGKTDFVIAGASDAPLAPLTYCAFDNINTMSRWDGCPEAHAYRPFAVDRGGFVMGEGSCAFVLEEMEFAKKRGATIYAEITGYSHNNEGHHMTSPDPTGAPLLRAINSALDDANTPREAVDYINGHASGTPLNDANELEALRTVFGDRFSSGKLPLSGTKPYTGHPLGATGAMEIAACLLAIHEGWVPPTLHLNNPDPAFAGVDLVPHHGREQKVKTALTNAFGFGGSNSCLILEAPDL